jgi:4-aminobutyrate aminotransferase-like enzyme
MDDTLERLARHESQNITLVEPDGSWPIVWERARGVHVWDSSGRKYLDLTAAFGVAAAGHANPRVVRAAKDQAATLLHAMGDVHPHRRKAGLVSELSRVTFERWGAGPAKTILGNSGFEAVEAALKTAVLATSRDRIVAFEGAYHGLGYGALSATHREHFRSPFRRQMREFASFVRFPETESDLPGVAAQVRSLAGQAGAVLVEPVQARGGIRVPPPQFLKQLRQVCDETGMLLILDEIYTGFGRTGRWFACEHSEVVPDLICLGKALTGGFPLSACVGRAELMDRAWPKSAGEAIHTSTYLGHPVGCAMALAQIREIEERGLPQAAAAAGAHLLDLLGKITSRRLVLRARGAGLMAGLELSDSEGRPATAEAIRAVKALLHRGFIFLPEGEHSNVIGFTPPLTIGRSQLRAAARALAEELA